MKGREFYICLDKGIVLLGRIIIGSVFFLSFFLLIESSYSADSGVDFRVQDDITVLGKEGTINDADLEVEGNTTAQRQVQINTEGLSTPFGGFGRGQNLLLRSEELDNAVWSTSNMTVSSESNSSIYAPNGTDGTAEVLTNNGSSGGYIAQTVSSGISTGADYVFSVWLRAGDSTSVELKIEDNDSQSSTYSTTSLDDKWKRYQVSFTTGSSASQITVTITNNGSDGQYIYAWGVQLDQAENTGVYVRTEGSAVDATRGAIINSDVRVGDGSFDNASNSDDMYVTGNLEVDGTIYGNINGDINPGFAQGSVAFGGPSGEITEDNSHLYWDDSNNRLGIGTTSPTTSLDINAGDLTLDNTTHSNQHGIIYKNGVPFITILITEIMVQ